MTNLKENVMSEVKNFLNKYPRKFNSKNTTAILPITMMLTIVMIITAII